MKFTQLVILLISLFSTEITAQVYESYPRGQESYIGGNAQFYKDFHQIIIDQDFKPCENKNELYSLDLVVYPDRKVKYIKDNDSLDVVRNKCAFDLARNVVKYMKAWKPAVIEGKEVAAITHFMIFPNDLFENYSESYDAEAVIKDATFEGGINAFRNKVVQNVNPTRFTWNQDFGIVVLFVVERDGSISNIRLEESSGLKEFDDMVIDGVASIKNKWSPATINGVPVRYRFKLPLRFQTR